MRVEIIIVGLIVFAALLLVFPVRAQDTGQVEFILKAGGSAQDTIIFLKAADNPAPFDSFYYPDRERIPNQNPEWNKVQVQPNGISFPEYFYAGDYVAAIRNGNGNQPEVQKFTLLKGEHKRVVFLGAAVGSGHKQNEPPVEPQEICTTYQVWIPGYYTYEEVWECYGYSSQNCACKWVTKCVWHAGHWESRTRCDK